MVVQTENPKLNDELGQGANIRLFVSRSLNLLKSIAE
jgi:hypothetical protein